MRVLLDFLPNLPTGWSVHGLAADGKTPISPYINVGNQIALFNLLRHVGADQAAIESVEEDIRQWGVGSVWVELKPGRKNLLTIYDRTYLEFLGKPQNASGSADKTKPQICDDMSLGMRPEKVTAIPKALRNGSRNGPEMLNSA